MLAPGEEIHCVAEGERLRQCEKKLSTSTLNEKKEAEKRISRESIAEEVKE